ncbi:MAG TPA: hypothetical protein VLH84_00805 [Patescibacteria group bacterium]|nr:hypothetical protein [Patescibacteria group bacterium]
MAQSHSSYKELVRQHDDEATARQLARAEAAAARAQELRDVLAPLALQAVQRQDAEAERARLIASQKLHEVKEVFTNSTATDVLEFLDDQAEYGHPNAITFEPLPPPAVAVAVAVPAEPTKRSDWSLFGRPSQKTATPAPTPTFEVAPPQAPAWSKQGYVYGAAVPNHWVTGMPLPELAVVFTDRTVGQVGSRVSDDGRRLEPITTEFPLPLHIGEDGRPVEPAAGNYTPLQPDLLQDDSEVTGAAFIVPSEANLLLLSLARANGYAPMHA